MARNVGGDKFRDDAYLRCGNGVDGVEDFVCDFCFKDKERAKIVGEVQNKLNTLFAIRSDDRINE